MMDFLKAEIERKKRQLEKNEVVGPNKKYFKRGDLAAKQQEDYYMRHGLLKPKNELEEKSSQKDPSTSGGTEEKEGIENENVKIALPRKEVIKRLRERIQPIRLFGEVDYEAYQRLKKLEILEPEVDKGFRNDFKEAMDNVDQEYLNEIQSTLGEDSSKTFDVRVLNDVVTEEDLKEMHAQLGQGDEPRDQEIILRFLKYLIQLWGVELNSRTMEEKSGLNGKLARAIYSQTVDYMKPLLKNLRAKVVPSDILECLAEIVKYLVDRHYLKANNAYLEMAIGNAPWPIGVTMVGIHARTGREKIFARNVAHVMNDETQRKYIQGLKRLMTKCQEFFPTDPARSYNFEKLH